MKLSESILYRLAKSWSSPVKSKQDKLGEDPSSNQYLVNYGLFYQYDTKVKNGVGVDIRGKRILEIGCGHGGITCFLGLNGAARAVGIDINVRNLEIAQKLKAQLFSDRHGSDLVEFHNMDATQLKFETASFDMIMADNVFEHFMEPELVLKECRRVLTSDGTIRIGSLPSYYSRYGLHLKNGLKMPWANLFFSEHTICDVMIRLCEENPSLMEIYPGVRDKPRKVKDLRAYGDLNGMTYSRLRRLAFETGFSISNFRVSPTPRIIGQIVQKLPIISRTIVGDIFSNKASCILKRINE